MFALFALALCRLASRTYGDRHSAPMGCARPADAPQVLRFERCTFTPSALLELAPLSRLKHIGFRQCDESMGCPRAMAMLAELCYRLDAITQAEIAVDDIEEQRPGDFMWRGAASQAQAALEARGKVVVVEVDEVS